MRRRSYKKARKYHDKRVDIILKNPEKLGIEYLNSNTIIKTIPYPNFIGAGKDTLYLTRKGKDTIDGIFVYKYKENDEYVGGFFLLEYTSGGFMGHTIDQIRFARDSFFKNLKRWTKNYNFFGKLYLDSAVVVDGFLDDFKFHTHERYAIYEPNGKYRKYVVHKSTNWKYKSDKIPIEQFSMNLNHA